MYEDDKIKYEEEEADEVGEINSDGDSKEKKKNIKKSFIVTTCQ